MKKFIVLHGEGPMPMDHHLINFFLQLLKQNKSRIFLKQAKITIVACFSRSENLDLLMKLKIVGEVKLKPIFYKSNAKKPFRH